LLVAAACGVASVIANLVQMKRFTQSAYSAGEMGSRKDRKETPDGWMYGKKEAAR